MKRWLLVAHLDVGDGRPRKVGGFGQSVLRESCLRPSASDPSANLAVQPVILSHTVSLRVCQRD
jgi:hypothetical protein